VQVLNLESTASIAITPANGLRTYLDQFRRFHAAAAIRMLLLTPTSIPLPQIHKSTSVTVRLLIAFIKIGTVATEQFTVFWSDR
jgi:hypothetical protein